MMETTSKLKDTTVTGSTGMPFIPEEDADAKVVRNHFNMANEQKKALEKESIESGHCMRLEAHFKRDLLIRAAFGPGDTAHGSLKTWSSDLSHGRSMNCYFVPLCGLLTWGTDVSHCERKILNAIRKKGPLTKSGVQKFSNADKSSGGYELWNRAWKALLQADRVIVMPQKSDRGVAKIWLSGCYVGKSETRVGLWSVRENF